MLLGVDACAGGGGVLFLLIWHRDIRIVPLGLLPCLDLALLKMFLFGMPGLRDKLYSAPNTR
jgi:hypothetical protein